ncbi:hypothetical protein JZ751_005301, partial [Albula glossodonta]
MNVLPCPEPRARLRKPKFTPDQIRVLIERVVAHGPQLYGERMSPVSVRKRIWQEVTLAINAISNTERSVIEVQKRWQDERRRIRHRAQDLWRALAETGVPMGRLTPLEEAVMSTFDEPVAKDAPEAGTGLGGGQCSLQRPRMGESSGEEAIVSQQPSPVSSPILAICVPGVSVEDIKQEPSEPTECPAEGSSWPQELKFECKVEDVLSVVSLRGKGTTPMGHPHLSQAPPPLPPPPPDGTALHTSPANQTRHNVDQSPLLSNRRQVAQQERQRRRLKRLKRRGPDAAGWAGLTTCLRRVASGTEGMRQDLRLLSDNVAALRGELGALVTAVSAVAGALLKGHHGDRNREQSGSTVPECEQQQEQNHEEEQASTPSLSMPPLAGETTVASPSRGVRCALCLRGHRVETTSCSCPICAPFAQRSRWVVSVRSEHGFMFLMGVRLRHRGSGLCDR